MKKIITIALALCLMISLVTVAFAEETATTERPQFSRENMPQGERPRFDPNNMPQGERPQFDPNNMPQGERPQFDPNNMPQGERPQFDPNNIPQGEVPQIIDEKTPRDKPTVTESEEPANKDKPGETSPSPTEEVVDENLPEGEPQPPMDMQQGGRQFGGMQNPRGGMSWNTRQTQAEPMTFNTFIKTYATPITAVVLLALAFVFVIFYKRKNY